MYHTSKLYGQATITTTMQHGRNATERLSLCGIQVFDLFPEEITHTHTHTHIYIYIYIYIQTHAYEIYENGHQEKNEMEKIELSLSFIDLLD